MHTTNPAPGLPEAGFVAPGAVVKASSYLFGERDLVDSVVLTIFSGEVAMVPTANSGQNLMIPKKRTGSGTGGESLETKLVFNSKAQWSKPSQA
ncbi:hypothetical protein GCM10009691_20140 [Brevibacterium picturae]|uniref:Uncharacterized protein n=1 Tax=Brevibacterium picturae TaxID=260553 RepID=A0ABN2BQI9_9MICO